MNMKSEHAPKLSAFAYAGVLVATMTVTCGLGYFLPKLISPALYKQASWVYDGDTRFDNTWLTYGTDYALAVMFGGAAFLLMMCQPSKLRNRSAALMLCYCISVMSGGIAHQFFINSPTNLDNLNSLPFKAIWTVCVGTVTLAGAYIGSIASAVVELIESKKQKNFRFRVPVVPEWFWIIWGLFLTALLVPLGALSMKRPACDIFIAGITQTLPSTYIFLAMLSNKWDVSVEVESVTAGGKGEAEATERRKVHQGGVSLGQVLVMVGFYLNAPLLPLYPLLVSLNLQLGVVNLILHSWLALAWGIQAIGLLYFARAYPTATTTVVTDKKVMCKSQLCVCCTGFGALI